MYAHPIRTGLPFIGAAAVLLGLGTFALVHGALVLLERPLEGAYRRHNTGFKR